jgi:hypothetical protein
MIPMIAAGPRIETVIRTVSEIVSFSEYGREIEASSRENACRLPWTFDKPPPTAKVALYGKRQQMKDRHGLGDDLQNNNPINNIWGHQTFWDVPCVARHGLSCFGDLHAWSRDHFSESDRGRRNKLKEKAFIKGVTAIYWGNKGYRCLGLWSLADLGPRHLALARVGSDWGGEMAQILGST